MRKMSNSETFDCDPETFWKVFFDDEFNKKMYLEGLGFKDVEVLERAACPTRAASAGCASCRP